MLRSCWNRLCPQPAKPSPIKKNIHKLSWDILEDRLTPSTFSVSTLADAGAGSLRQAILDANTNPGPDDIAFSVAGTIRLTSAALPDITDTLAIDGRTAPGYAGKPRVELNARGFGGLRFDLDAHGSSLTALSITGAGGAGVTLHADGITLLGNYIGLKLDGKTPAGNRGDGIAVFFADHIIGGVNPGEPNLISANGGNGVSINGGSANQIRANFIGTDSTGKKARPNAGNGILLTNGADHNIIGGTTPAYPPGTQPPQFTGVRPPEGNVISGNKGNGIRIAGGSSDNFLAGNFIGTDATGVKGLGNQLDGVFITEASNNNWLAGTFIQLDPFIFYNVISGNHGNGLRVRDSDGTQIHANFFGLGSDNKTPVGNRQNGVVVEGTSTMTQFGGHVPLGNVVAANRKNGMVVADSASEFLAFNTFNGVGAFVNFTNLGNHGDGLRITSTGGDNTILFNLFSRNWGDGIEVACQASGVQLVKNGVGVDLHGTTAMPNRGNGITIGGNANNITIGGPSPEPSLGPQNVLSGNHGYGVAILDSAHDILINDSAIGTTGFGHFALGNRKGGVFLGPGTHSTTIGSTDPELATIISGNRGDGITMFRSSGNTVIGTHIGLDIDGKPIPNRGQGIYLRESSGNQIGGFETGEANSIAANRGSGVWIRSGQHNGIHQNSIFENADLGIRLSRDANNRQSSPVLTSSTTLLGTTTITGTLLSKPNSFFTIEIYADSRSHPLRAIEGRIVLGTVSTFTDALGRAQFSFDTLLPLTARALTATATDDLNNTSEFSLPLLLTS